MNISAILREEEYDYDRPVTIVSFLEVASVTSAICLTEFGDFIVCPISNLKKGELASVIVQDPADKSENDIVKENKHTCDTCSQISLQSPNDESHRSTIDNKKDCSICSGTGNQYHIAAAQGGPPSMYAYCTNCNGTGMVDK